MSARVAQLRALFGSLIRKDPAERICVQLSVDLTASVAGGPGCSTETGSDAGKVFFRASSSACSRRQYSRLPRLFTSRCLCFGVAIISVASIAFKKSELIFCSYFQGRLGVLPSP